jgi:hypothetical protein
VIGNYYTFYLNPAIPNEYSQNFGVRRIDYKKRPVFILDAKQYLNNGILAVFLTVVLVTAMYAYYVKNGNI